MPLPALGFFVLLSVAMMAFLAYMAVGAIDLLFAELVVFGIYIVIYTHSSSSHF